MLLLADAAHTTACSSPACAACAVVGPDGLPLAPRSGPSVVNPYSRHSVGSIGHGHQPFGGGGGLPPFGLPASGGFAAAAGLLGQPQPAFNVRISSPVTNVANPFAAGPGSHVGGGGGAAPLSSGTQGLPGGGTQLGSGSTIFGRTPTGSSLGSSLGGSVAADRASLWAAAGTGGGGGADAGGDLQHQAFYQQLLVRRRLSIHSVRCPAMSGGQIYGLVQV